MSTYEIRTHRNGRTYNLPHFFILNKGLNSGKPMSQSCPNCFVLTTKSEAYRESLFYLCLSLKIGNYFRYYLKGSVIPFICISDAKKSDKHSTSKLPGTAMATQSWKAQKNKCSWSQPPATTQNNFKTKNYFAEVII